MSRFHSLDDMVGMGEFEVTPEGMPAVVLRGDGSIDVYGDVIIVDQRMVRKVER